MFVCPAPELSQVMMKWRCQASHLGRFTLLHNGRRATQLSRFALRHNGRRATQLSDLLCGITAAGLHNSVDSLCGTTAAELNNPVSLMRAPGVAHIFQRQRRAILKYEGLMIRSKTLLKLLNALEDNSTNTEPVKVRQNVSNRLKVRQMCVDDKCNLEKTSLINCTGHPIITEHPKQIRGCVLVPQTQSISVEIPSCRL